MAWPLACWIACAGLVACGPTRAQEAANQRERFTRMLDERRYTELVQLLSPQQPGGTTSEYPDLLAMAYLGRSGFEPLDFARSMLGQQPENAALPGLEALFSDCTREAVVSADVLPFRCVLKRVWVKLPQADAPDFAAARELFRTTFPCPEDTQVKYNTLIAVVEAASALSRVGQLAALSSRIGASALSLEEGVAVPLLAVSAAVEAAWTLKRARYAVAPLSRLLLGSKQELLLVGAGATLAWAESTGLPQTQRFAASAGTIDAASFLHKLISNE